MSLIQGPDPCVYQLDGRCTLVRAASQGQPGYLGCINFVPRVGAHQDSKLGWNLNPLQQCGQSLPDVSHPD